MSSKDELMPDTAGRRARRIRVTSRKVLVTDKVTSVVINVGGVAVIAAVLAILVYLVLVVLPLFGGAKLSPGSTTALGAAGDPRQFLIVETDEYRSVLAVIRRDGEVFFLDASSGRLLQQRNVLGGESAGVAITSFSRPVDGRSVAFGFSDGTVRTGTVEFVTDFLDEASVVPSLRSLEKGKRAQFEDGVVEHVPTGEWRRVRGSVELGAPLPVADASAAVKLLQYRPADGGSRFAAYLANGTLAVNEVSERENLLTGEMVRDVSAHIVPVPPELTREVPLAMLFTSKGDQLYLAWVDGRVARFDLRDMDAPLLAELTDFTTGDARLTLLRFMYGEQSLLSGDSEGNVRGWFKLASADGRKSDGAHLVPAHLFASSGGAVTTISTSVRDKSFLVGRADGTITLYHLTSEQRLGEFRLPAGASLIATQIAPKSDGVLAVTADGTATIWPISNPHPETTWTSIFRKVWYEGYAAPEHTWQSSSGTDDFEPKFGLIPLIFGTLKATVYSMLFAVPVALFGAIYSSEFLDKRYRAPVKSTIEMMASLPSVVLGFIAALVLAPIVENFVMAVITAFLLIPVAALAAGYLWQLLPRTVAIRLEGAPVVVLLLLVVAGACVVGANLGGVLEDLIFFGDFKAWLDGRVGNGAPGIALVLWPALFFGLLWVDRSLLSDRIAAARQRSPQSVLAIIELVKFLAIAVLSVGLAWLAGETGAALGFDLRGVLFATYVQRNALVVGFVIGFAVIPIVYTIAEDALNSVPATLRSASLGCGATRWQTATRVVLPVATSGIFSAVMIGLGRAVGETMIVLMAAGNTAIMDFNIFNGLRTLSANIAVELPEAVKDGTLYRMLFLAALALFVMTFVVNTVAEIIRQRFRKRAYQL
ncbi:MAG: ABC transporter permease subunit [Thermoanaerobaculia bacterium]|jgi:phosphate transport system permease protein